MDHQLHDAESVKSNKDKRSFTFEEAVTCAGFGKFHYVLLLGCAMGQFGVVFQLYITSYLLPSVQCDFRINAQQKGLLTSISYIGVILGSYLWGLLADTRGRKSVLVATLMLDAVCGVLSSIAPDFYVFLGLRFLNGFFICCAGAVVFPYVGEFFITRYRPSAIMVLNLYLPLGLLILPGLAWLVIPQRWSVELPWCTYSSWRIFVALCSVPSALGCVITAFILPESPKYLMVHGEAEKTLVVLRGMYAMNTGDKQANYAVQHITPGDENVDNVPGKSVMQQLKNMWFEQTLPLFKMPHIKYSFLFFVFEFGAFACFNSLALWLPDVFNNMASFALANGRPGTICESMSAAAPVLDDLASNQTIALASHNSSEPPSFWMYSLYPDNASESWENVAHTTNTDEAELAGADACEVTINPETFTNSLIVSVSMVLINVVLGVALRWFTQKSIIVTFMTSAFVFVIVVNFVSDDTVVLVLTCLFFCTCGGSAGLMMTAAVDLFPTSLRGMAVCLGMMMARTGVVVGSQIIAALIEYSCPAVFYIEAGTVVVCGVLAFMLPGRNKK